MNTPPEKYGADKVPLNEQVACIKREVALRRNVYAKRVAARTMKPAEAEKEIAVMEAVLYTVTRAMLIAEVGMEMLRNPLPPPPAPKPTQPAPTPNPEPEQDEFS